MRSLPTDKSDLGFAGPAPVTVQVVRDPLVAIIVEARGTLTLLTAPVGFGKSTVMAQTFHHLVGRDARCAWLDASATYNDLPRFLDRLDTIVAYLELTRPGQDAITCLANARKPFALFVDDLENIHEPSVLYLLHEIAQRLPHRCYLVIGCRTMPALRIAKLRMDGRLTEIDSSQLRFGLEESEHLLGLHVDKASLVPSEVAQLHQKTEGWVAALWLAAIALKRAKNRSDFVAQFSGLTGTVAQYLAEVVLADQPNGVRRFLLRISILKQFNLSVCEALNLGVDSRRMVEHLVTQGLVIPVDARQGYWRFHGLFAQYLRSQLDEECPQERPVLNLLASRWFETQSQPVLAIEHAISGQQYDQAIVLLEAHATTLLEQGRMRLLSRWFGALPEATVDAHPVLLMISIWAVALTEGAHEASKILERIDWRDSDNPRVRNHGAALFPTLLGMQDRCEEALTSGMWALDHMEAGHDFASATLLNAIAHQILIIGKARDAQRMVDAARRLHGGESLFNRMYSETTEGLIDMLHGRLRHASARFRLAVDTPHSSDNRHAHGNAWAGVLLTATVYEANDLTQTKHLINVYLPLAREVGIPDHLILIYLLKCRVAFTEHDLDGALEALTELEYLGHSRSLQRAVAAAQLERAKMLLMQGNALASDDELLRADDPQLWARECRQRLLAHDIHYLRLARLRWEIHFGDPASALLELDVDLQKACAEDRLHRALVLRLLKAMALIKCEQDDVAHGVLQESVSFAAREGYVRTLLDEGASLGCALRHFKKAYEHQETPDPLILDYLARLLAAFGPMVDQEAVSSAPAVLLKEKLTRKEIAVLSLLTEGYTNKDLVTRLNVSDSTVRTHLRNINAKLNTTNRNQALAVARKSGLIS